MSSSTGLAISYDPRDLTYDAGSLASPSMPQKSGRRLRHQVPTRDQGDVVRCCVSVTIVTCMEILDAQIMKDGFTPLSVLFHYYAARKYAGKDIRNFGDLTFQDGFRAVLQYGICARKRHPSEITPDNARLRPSDAAFRNADHHKIARDRYHRWQYRQIKDLNLFDMWREILDARHPIALGLWLTDAYHDLPQTGAVHGIPYSRTSVCHAVTVIGYNNQKRDAEGEEKGAFLIKDSRGPHFGNNGCWWLPYKLVNKSLIYQSWTITGVNY